MREAGKGSCGWEYRARKARKVIEDWPVKDHRKRPRDPSQLAKLIVTLGNMRANGVRMERRRLRCVRRRPAHWSHRVDARGFGRSPMVLGHHGAGAAKHT